MHLADIGERCPALICPDRVQVDHLRGRLRSRGWSARPQLLRDGCGVRLAVGRWRELDIRRNRLVTFGWPVILPTRDGLTVRRGGGAVGGRGFGRVRLVRSGLASIGHLVLLSGDACDRRQLRRWVAEAGEIEVRRHADRRFDPVGEAQLDRLVCGEPGLRGHQRLDLGVAGAGLVPVGGDHRGRHLVQRVRRRAHVGGRARGQPGGFVQHEHRVLGHHDLVARHRDHARDRSGDAVNPDRDPGLVALQRVVDRDAIEHRAARAVDPHRQLGDRAEPLQLVEEGLGRDAEGADLVVDHDLGRAPRLGAELVPALQATFSSVVVVW